MLQSFWKHIWDLFFPRKLTCDFSAVIFALLTIKLAEYKGRFKYQTSCSINVIISQLNAASIWRHFSSISTLITLLRQRANHTFQNITRLCNLFFIFFFMKKEYGWTFNKILIKKNMENFLIKKKKKKKNGAIFLSWNSVMIKTVSASWQRQGRESRWPFRGSSHVKLPAVNDRARIMIRATQPRTHLHVPVNARCELISQCHFGSCYRPGTLARIKKKKDGKSRRSVF